MNHVVFPNHQSFPKLTVTSQSSLGRIGFGNGNACTLSHFSRVRLCESMDCSPPGSSVHGDSPGKNTGVGFLALLQGKWQYWHLIETSGSRVCDLNNYAVRLPIYSRTTLSQANWIGS